jgi:CubicO group peptidase (beta-lactamase class C family)/D-alanyl-D-alanine dipeptidase
MPAHLWERASSRLRRSVLVALVAAGAAACGVGETAIEPPPGYAAAVRSIEAFIEREMATKELPAVSIALVDDQRIVWARGFGFARPEDGVPATAATVYRVGSVSKLFTDIAVMQLVERGELDLDAPVETYLPDFRPANPFGTPVTLRHLMAHRSGLVREPPVGNYFDDSGASLAETVASLNGTELVYAPGSRTKYSNAGIAVVGRLLEHVTGEPFAQRVESAVLRPAGLDRSSFEPRADLLRDLATAYMWGYDGRRFEAPRFPLGMAPAGGMYSTVTDLARFLSMLLAGGRAAGGAQVLREESLAEMWRPQFAAPGETTGFGLGFAIRELDGRRRIGHSGAIYGFATELAFLPDEKLGVVAVTTLDAANVVVERIADHALRAMLAARVGAAPPAPDTTAPLPEGLAAALEGRYEGKSGDVELVDRYGRLLLVPLRGGFRTELRAAGDALIADGRLAYGTRVVPIGTDALVVGGDTLRRVPVRRPAPPPERWRGLIGEYGWDHNILYILERDGRLHALIEWFFEYPLEEAWEDVFAFPDWGLYAGERLVFSRDANGRATSVRAAGIVFPRRNVGTEAGETFRIAPVRPVEELRAAALAASPPREEGEFREPELVELITLDPTIRLDIRYATTNNFMGSVFYTQPRAFLQRPAAEALVRAHRKLREQGFGVLIHDAYRPWHVTKMFWDATPERQKIFVADPSKGSRHNRGSAVDLTLFDLRTGEPVEMVSGYDEFSDRSFADYPGGTSLQRWHREVLRDAMEAEGFRVYDWEWWHFDYGDWAAYPILDIPFEEIPASSAAGRPAAAVLAAAAPHAGRRPERLER